MTYAKLAVVLASVLYTAVVVRAQGPPAINPQGTYSNAPGGIVICWIHQSVSVESYWPQARVAGTKGPLIGYPVGVPKTSGCAPVLGLNPNTLYEVRICATYFQGEPECSHEEDQAWPTVRTMAAPPTNAPGQPGGTPSGTPSTPAINPIPGPMPSILAITAREQDQAKPVVVFRNRSFRDHKQEELKRVGEVILFRGTLPVDRGLKDIFFDRNPPEWATYTICYTIRDGAPTCSYPAGAGYQGIAGFLLNIGTGEAIRYDGQKLTDKSPAGFATQATWIVRPGLAAIAGGISLEVAGTPNTFLTDSGTVAAVAALNNGSPEFAPRATFQILVPPPGYAPETGYFNLEPVSRRGTRLMYHDNRVIFGSVEQSLQEKGNAAFMISLATPKAFLAQIRSVAGRQLTDVRMPEMVKPQVRPLGKKARPDPNAPPGDPCEMAVSARTRGMNAAIIAALEQKCAEKRGIK